MRATDDHRRHPRHLRRRGRAGARAVGGNTVSDATVPEGIIKEVRYWIDIFCLESWEVDVVLDRVVNESSDCLGWCERNANYNHARLHLRDDIEDTKEWRKVILHECLHIVMARVDAYIQDAVIPNLAEASHDIAGMSYKQHVESFVQMLTHSFWRFYAAQMKREPKQR